MTRKKQPQTEEQDSRPFSKKDFINSIVKKKQKNKFLSTAAIISMTDKRGKIIFVNEKFEKVSGWKLKR